MDTSFPEYAFDHVLDNLTILAIPSLVFLAAAAGVLFFLRRWLGAPLATAILVGITAVLLVTVLGIALFEASALWYLSAPHGSGRQRLGGDFEDFYAVARLGFIALYGSLLLVALGSGWVLGRRWVGRGSAVAVATVVAIAAFLVLTFPLVEFMNACDVGRPFLLDDVRC
jgi:hypothetical protein